MNRFLFGGVALAALTAASAAYAADFPYQPPTTTNAYTQFFFTPASQMKFYTERYGGFLQASYKIN